MSRKAVAIVLVLLLSVSGLAAPATSEAGPAQACEGGRSGHTPININGNAAFSVMAQNENWGGNGTAGNPYLIKDYDINGTGTGYCIRISATTVYFKIDNCTLKDATGGSGHPSGYSGCLDLIDSDNGACVNTTIARSTWCGVVVRQTSANVLLDNLNVSGSPNWAMITCDNVYNCTVSNSTLKNFNVGISFYRTTYSSILNNNITGAQSNGITLDWECYYNNIINNTVSTPNGENIWISLGCDYNNIIGNNISRGYCGIRLWADQDRVPDYNTIAFNKISGCAEGILGDIMMPMFFPTGNKILNNDISGGQYSGIDMIWYFNTIIRNNTCNNFGDSGILCNVISNSIVENNTCKGNGDRGIELSDSSGVTVKNNTCANNFHGMTLSYMSGSSLRVTNNTCFNNTYHGISVDQYSDGSIISDNYCRGNGATGLSIWYNTDGCVLFNNTVTNNKYGIDVLDGCINNRILNCTVSKNVVGFNVGSGITGTIVHSCNIINNGIQAGDLGTNNRWNATYPLGGNFWSDYKGTDQYSGAYPQSTPGSDGFGDSRYSLEPADVHRDYYPLMLPAMNGLPNSTADPLPRYWYNMAAFVTATAKDDHEGVGSVTLYSNYSKNNSTWSAARTVGKDVEEPWSWGFNFEQGEGHYRFFTDCIDAVENPERPKTSYKEAACGFDGTKPTVSITSPIQDQEFRTPDVKLVWDGADALSRLDHFEFMLDGKDWIDVGKDTTRLLSGLADRPHSAAIRAYDEAGNFNETFVSFKVDANLPLVGIGMPFQDQLFASPDIDVEWFGMDEGMGLARFDIALDAGASEDMGINTTRPYINLSDGPHTITVTAFDVLGNNASVSVSFMIDTVMPAISITTPANGALLNTSSVRVEWAGSDATSGIELYEVRFDASGWFGVGVDTGFLLKGLSEGTHIFEVRAVDRSGNINSTNVSFTVDTVAPALTITPPAGLLASSSLTVGWNCSDATTGVKTCEYRLDTGAWTDSGANRSVQLASVPDGTHDFEVRVMDKVGNMASQRVRFTVDTTAPLVSIASPSEGAFMRVSAFTAQWNGSDATSGIALFEARLDIGDWLKTGTGLLYNFQSVPDGNHTLMVRATDLAGNSRTANVSFIIDTKPVITDITPPTIISTSPSGLGVRLTEVVTINFSEPIDPASLKFACSPDPGSWVVLWNADFTRAILLHADFAYKTSYSVVISAAKDMAGNPLSNSTILTFTTVKPTAAPKPVQTGVDASIVAIPFIIVIVLVIALLYVMAKKPKGPAAPKGTAPETVEMEEPVPPIKPEPAAAKAPVEPKPDTGGKAPAPAAAPKPEEEEFKP
jgi:parallel beta-helix repeat protein